MLSFEEIRNVRKTWGHISRESRRAINTGFNKETKISSSLRPLREEEQVTKKTEKKGDSRLNVFARIDDDKPAEVQKVRFQGIRALMNSTSGN